MYLLRSLFFTLPHSICPLLLFILLLSQFTVSQDEQNPLAADVKDPPKPKTVAVIGAGSAGASTAYYLRTYSDFFSVPVDITVFEKSSHVGGRSTTVNVFDDPTQPIEVGASIFVQTNKNLMKAAKRFGLKINEAGQGQPKEAKHSLGVWDGTEFVFKQRETTFRWLNIFQLLWRYGWAPMRAQNLMKATVEKFMKLYRWPYFPWKSLSSVVMSSGLVEATWSTGAEFLKENQISEEFSREIIQASTRVNYGQNLPLIHGLETMVCMATDGAVSVEGGNWQIFQGMLDASEATLNFNSAVSGIRRNGNNTYTVSYTKSDDSIVEKVFDQVVVANPFQYSNIELNPPLDNQPDKIPYVKLHVTLFSSPHKLSPKHFRLAEDVAVPEVVLTTLPENAVPGADRDGVGPAGFWSISTLRKTEPPDGYHPHVTDGPQYVYKVFSPKPLTIDFITGLLDLEKMELLTRDVSNGTMGPSPNLSIKDFSKSDISWYHEKVWHSYPFLYPRVTFEDIKLAPNLWYTSGIESFISTMETSSLSGMNVAALILSQWISRFDSKLKMYEDSLSP